MANVMKFSGDGIRVPILSADPSSPQDGQIWYNSTDAKFKQQENGAVKEVAASEISDSDFRIVDNGDGTKKIAFEASGITTGTTRTITMPDAPVDLVEVNTSIQRDGSRAFTANQDMGGNKLTNLAAPTADSDAARKLDVDAAKEGLDVKDSVRAASTTNVDLTVTGDGTLDGVTLADGDRVLLKDQTTASENGIYVANTAADQTTWTRSEDADEDSEVTAGMFTFIEEGTSFANTGFVLTTADPITVGTTSLSFAQFSGAGQLTAGAGLTKTGDTLDVGDANKGVQANADDLEIDASESSGNGIKQNATNSWQFDVEADTTSTTTTEANAINVSSAGVNVKVDDSTLEGSAQGTGSTESLRLKDGGITNAKVNASAGILYSKLASSAVDTDIVPDGDNTRSLGSSANNWAAAHSKSVESSTSLSLSANSGSGAMEAISDTFSRGKASGSLVEQEYLDSITLTDNTTAVVSEFTFAVANYSAIEIEYLIREATSLNTRTGRLMVVTDDTNVSIVDTSTEAGDPGVSFSAAVNTGNVEISYTTTSTTNARTMRADVKRYRAI